MEKRDKRDNSVTQRCLNFRQIRTRKVERTRKYVVFGTMIVSGKIKKPETAYSV